MDMKLRDKVVFDRRRGDIGAETSFEFLRRAARSLYVVAPEIPGQIQGKG